MRLCLINEATVDQVQRKIPVWIKKYFNHDQSLASEVIPDIIKADPTKGKYSEWLIRQWKNQTAIFPEDTEKLAKSLSLFDQKKSKLQEKDINRYTPSELAKTLEQQLGLTNSERRDARRGKMHLPPGAKFIGKSGEFSVVKITDATASSLLCSGTEWCVANKDTAEHYLKSGPLFLIYENDERKYLAQVESQQYMDVYDEPVGGKLKKIIQSLIMKFDKSATIFKLIDDHYNDLNADRLVEIVEGSINSLVDNPTLQEYRKVKDGISKSLKYILGDNIDIDIMSSMDKTDYLRKLGEYIGKVDETMLSAIKNDNGDFKIEDFNKYLDENIYENPVVADWIVRNTDFSEMYNYYYNSGMISKSRWPVLENLAEELAYEGHYRVVYERMREYAMHHHIRIPWIEDRMIQLVENPVGDVSTLASQIAHYAVDAMQARWPKMEPFLKHFDFVWATYQWDFNIDDEDIE